MPTTIVTLYIKEKSSDSRVTAREKVSSTLPSNIISSLATNLYRIKSTDILFSSMIIVDIYMVLGSIISLMVLVY